MLSVSVCESVHVCLWVRALTPKLSSLWQLLLPHLISADFFHSSLPTV